ncbi:MAG: hypothetical protein ACRCUY_07905 [Thermoguttaceae bacterium]
MSLMLTPTGGTIRLNNKINTKSKIGVNGKTDTVGKCDTSDKIDAGNKIASIAANLPFYLFCHLDDVQTDFTEVEGAPE